MELRVAFTANCAWPDLARAARGVVSVILIVVVIVLVLDGRLPIEALAR